MFKNYIILFIKNKNKKAVKLKKSMCKHLRVNISLTASKDSIYFSDFTTSTCNLDFTDALIFNMDSEIKLLSGKAESFYLEIS